MRRLVVRPPAGPPGRAKAGYRWDFDNENQQVVNPGLGVVVPRVDVVWEDTGELHHEGFIMAISRRAEQDVVVDEDGHLGLINIWREKVVPPDVCMQIWANDPRAIPRIEHVTGVLEWEVAQGLALKVGEEAEEEIGRAVLTKQRIGYMVPNTPMGGNGHELMYITVGKRPSGQSPDESEGIRRVKFFPPEHVRDMIVQMASASSVAALAKFRSWALCQPRGADFDQLAHGVASRL